MCDRVRFGAPGVVDRNAAASVKPFREPIPDIAPLRPLNPCTAHAATAARLTGSEATMHIASQSVYSPRPRIRRPGPESIEAYVPITGRMRTTSDPGVRGARDVARRGPAGHAGLSLNGIDRRGTDRPAGPPAGIAAPPPGCTARILESNVARRLRPTITAAVDCRQARDIRAVGNHRAGTAVPRGRG